MSLYSRRHQRAWTPKDVGWTPGDRAGVRTGAVAVTNDSAQRHSAVWSLLDLRGGLMSSFPVDVYRNVAGIRVELPKPPVLVDPGGSEWDYVDWMYATQRDLDRAGNTIGLVTEVNGAGLPARIDLQPIDICSVIIKKDTGEKRFRIGGKEYTADKVWHERQYLVAGLPVGLSPVAYAALSIGEALSMQDFALQWFGAGGTPNAHLRNTIKQTLTPGEATATKARWRATVQVGEPLVTGKDWEYKPIQSEAVGMEWLEGRRWSVPEICRFFGGSADLIDGTVAGQSVTYANMTERNLQFLVMKLGPAVRRREKNLSKLLPRPRYVKLNTDALLRMDPKSRAELIATRIRSRTLTVTEARALDDLPPLTPEQEAEFVRLFGAPKQLNQAGASRAAAADDPDDDVAAVERAMGETYRTVARVGRPLNELEG